VIFDYPSSQILRRLERAGGALLGVILLFAALLASVVAVPTTL